MTTTQTTEDLWADFEDLTGQLTAGLEESLKIAQQIPDMVARVTASDELAAELQVRMAARDERVAELEAQLAERDKRIAELEERNTRTTEQSTERVRTMSDHIMRLRLNNANLNRQVELACTMAEKRFAELEAETAAERLRADNAEAQVTLLRAEVAEQANSLYALQNELETVRGMPGNTAQPWSAYEPGVETELLVPQIVAAEPVPDELAAFRKEEPPAGLPAGLELIPVGAAAAGNGASRSDEPTKSQRGAWMQLTAAFALLMASVIPPANPGRRAPKQKSDSRSRWTALKEWGNAEEPLFTRGRSGPGKEAS